MFSYTPSGHVVKKNLLVYKNSTGSASLDLEGAFGYDNEGRLASITYPDPQNSTTVSYAYTFDAMGRLSGMNNSGSVAVASGAQYDAASHLTQLTYGLGTETRSFNNLNELTNIRVGDSINMQYSYNTGSDNGQITQAVDRVKGESVMYSYDSLKRLSSGTASAVPVAYDESFEQVSLGTNWTVQGTLGQDFEITDQKSHSGTYSLQLLSTAGQLTQVFACTPSTSYVVSGYYQAPYQGASILILEAGTSPQYNLAAALSWTQFSYSFSTGATCSGTVGITLFSLTGGGVAYFDDISITKNAGSNWLGDPGFEFPAVAHWSLSAARQSVAKAHGGVRSELVPSGGYAQQTVTGAIPSTSYPVSVWYYNSAGATATLTVGSTATNGTTVGAWTLLVGSGSSDASGNLVIKLSASGASVYFDDVTVGTVNPSNPVATWGQSFGYDGFGNLLTQTPTAGSAPSMNLSVSSTTNRVTNSGVVYDASGNLTQTDSSHTYSFDEMNRMKATGSYLYTYGANDNKRIIAYNNVASPTAYLNLYTSDGRRMGSYNFYSLSGSWANAQVSTGGETNYLWFGSKPLNYADDRVGSNRSAGQYYPYGQMESGTAVSEGQSFGTYVQDAGSGLLYADQRYYLPHGAGF